MTLAVESVHMPNELDGVLLQKLVIVVSPEEREGFDRLEIWRSRGGLYEALTGEGYGPPRTPGGAPTGSAGALHVIVGKTLTFLVQESRDVVITFTGTDPLTTAACAAQITTQSAGTLTAWVDSEGQLVVASVHVGSDAVLEVTGGTAAALLKLPVDVPFFGYSSRLVLQDEKQLYTFRDSWSHADYLYKVRLFNSYTTAHGPWSLPFQAGAKHTSRLATVLGTLQIVGVDGCPLDNVKVGIYNGFQPSRGDGPVVVESQQNKLTDDNGRVEFSLVRGTTCTVSIFGTNIARRITVPTDLTLERFHLLGAEAGAEDDSFTVSAPVVHYGARRSL